MANSNSEYVIISTTRHRRVHLILVWCELDQKYNWKSGVSLTRKVWSKFKTKFGCSHYILKSPLSLFHIKKKQLSLLSSPRGSGWTLLLLCPTWQSFHIRLFTLLICNEGKGFPEERYLSSCLTIWIFFRAQFSSWQLLWKRKPITLSKVIV